MARRLPATRTAWRKLALAARRSAQRRAFCGGRRGSLGRQRFPRRDGSRCARGRGGRTLMRALVVLGFLIFAGAAAAQTTPPSAPADCEACPELAVVPPGQFRMGSAPDAPELDV